MDKKQQNVTLKKVVGKLHLWLGFASGLLVFVIAITGCLYAFKTEIENATQSYRTVERYSSHHVLAPSELIAIAQKELPGKNAHSVQYGDDQSSAQVSFYNYEPSFYYYIVFVNPVDGTVLKVRNMEHDFFHFVLDGHFYLWLPPTIGQPVVATATLVFVVMLISGMILWWPAKNKAKQRFTIKANTQWRRKNYDLHNVLGFYAMTLLLVLGLTGLVWGFQWFANSVYAIAGGTKSLQYAEPQSDTLKHRNQSVIDKVWMTMKSQYPATTAIEVHTPETALSSIAANANFGKDTYWQMDFRYFDQYTAKELQVDHVYGRLPKADAVDKLLRMNYDIHTGAILGFAGKLLAFCASLIAASLPITGFIIWYGRKYKVKKKRPVKLVEDFA